MKWKIILWVLLHIGTMMAANIGQPGVWQAGGGGFALNIEADSIALNSISMLSERVDISLYSGFALVYGRYSMKNTSQDTLSFTMGYPVNGLWRGESQDEPFGYSFWVDSLAGFQVEIDGKAEEGLVRPWTDNTYNKTGQWVTWEVDFLPMEAKEITISYMVSTEGAFVTNMSGKKEAQGLIYVFDTGGPWKGEIGKAELYIHFEDGLSQEDLIGLRPCNEMQLAEAEGKLKLEKTNWEPQKGENFYLLYTKRKNKYYPYSQGIEDREELINRARERRKELIGDDFWVRLDCADILEVETTYAFKNVISIMIAGAFFLFGLILFLIARMIKKRKS